MKVPASITPEPVTIRLTESLTDMLTPFYCDQFPTSGVNGQEQASVA